VAIRQLNADIVTGASAGASLVFASNLPACRATAVLAKARAGQRLSLTREILPGKRVSLPSCRSAEGITA
jgi:hypothetical protein